MPKPNDREARLAEALRANLRRRKAHGKAERATEPSTSVTADPDGGQESVPASEETKPLEGRRDASKEDDI